MPLIKCADRSHSPGLVKEVIETRSRAKDLPCLFRSAGWHGYEAELKSAAVGGRPVKV